MTATGDPRTGISRQGLDSRFWRVLAAQSLSSVGTGLHLVALPLLATTYTHDPRVIAALATVAGVPALVLALPVGNLVDRTHRGRLMVYSDLACVLVVAALTAAVLVDVAGLWLLFTVAALLGVAELVFSTGLYALIPTIVPRGHLLRANSHLAVGREIGAGGIGPALAGVAFSAAPALPFAINAVSFAASAAAIGSFAIGHGTRPNTPAPDTDPPATAKTRLSAYVGDLTAGVRFAARHRTIRTTLLLSAGAGLFGWMPEGILVLFAKQELGATDVQFGLLMAVTAAGTVLGGLVVPRLAHRTSMTRLVVSTYLIYGALLIPVALTDSILLVMALFFVQGLPLIASGAAVQSAQQALVPDHLLGRTAVLRHLINALTMPAGLTAGGFLGTWLSLDAVWIIAGTGFLIVVALCGPGLRNLEPRDAHQS
ncbi:transmembrane secretion effector [Promicromonospora sp. AC04]|uniref:MFS transporter n=1 Tax=Promicromonospora sp. AC04 TaxID=2135723 RepID=UPI000D381696|nr:MFS transporter [Promicromonospora sp. AC04]PUB32447.1 transmembrane secretion effector [Promicromonospora sp. AC04]